jgi:putative Mn2+ efflux pump MntP
MSLFSVLFIAVGLAMDAFAVSVANGVTVKRQRLRHALTIALFFGLFQGIMPVMGWLAGTGFRSFISGIDHWIAFGLLIFVGGKMIYESTKLERTPANNGLLSLSVLLLLSVATSIDALAIGLSFAFLKIEIITPAIVIGVVTFTLSLVGVFVGQRLGHLLERKIEVIGGIILLGIGFKILIEHLG